MYINYFIGDENTGDAEQERPQDMLLWHPYGLEEDKTEAFLSEAAIAARGDLQLVGGRALYVVSLYCRLVIQLSFTRAHADGLGQIMLYSTDIEITTKSLKGL